LIHAREAFGAAKAFFGLPPFEHEVRRQDGGYAVEVIGSHEAPQFARDLSWVGAGHGLWSDGLGRSLAEGIMFDRSVRMRRTGPSGVDTLRSTAKPARR
jgi:hypothetical protein